MSAQVVLALQRAAGNRAVARSRAVKAVATRSRAASEKKPSVAPSQTGPVPAIQRLAADGGGAMAFLEPVRNAAPSQLGEAVAGAGAAGPSALDASREGLASALPTQAAPTGLTPGVTAPTAAAVPATATAPERPTAGKSDLGPSGPSDPAVADQWAASGTQSIAAAASTAAITAPDAETVVRPVTAPSTLTPGPLGAAQPLAVPAAQARAAGEEKAVLDGTMGDEVSGMLTGLLAPSLASGSAHAAAATTIGADARARVATADQDSAGQQQAMIGQASAQVSGIRTAWSAQKTALVQEHQGQISTEASRTRAEATQTVRDADARAKETEKAAQQSGGDAKPGLWDRIKSAGAAVVSTVRDAAASVVAGVRGILAAARDKVTGLLGRLASMVRERVAAAVRAISDGARRAAAAVAGAIRAAQDTVTRIAKSAQELAGRIWRAATDRLKAAWQAIQAAAAAAMRAAAAVVKKVSSALTTVKEILKLLGDRLVGFIMDLINDPRGKIIDPIVALAAPMVAGVPAKAEELTKQNAPPEAAMSGGQGAVAQREVVQRDVVQREVKAPKAPPGETFWGGVGRHLGASVDNFLANWASILGGVIWDVLTLYPVLLREGPELWKEIVAIKDGGGGLDRLDHALLAVRHLVSLLGSVVATVGVWALIIGLLGGPVAEGVVLTVYEGISVGLIVTDLSLAALEMSKYAYSATRPEVDPESRDRYIGMFTGSGIAAAITLVLIALGMLAARLAKAFKLRRIAAAAIREEARKPPVPENKPKPPETNPPETKPPETKPPETPAGPTPYDPKVRSNAELQLDLDPAPRVNETPAQAAERVEAARGELQTRVAMGIYEALGDKPPRTNMRANDAAHGADGAHTLERHGPDVQLRGRPPGPRTVEGRIHGDPPWGRAENWSYKWIDEPTMNRTINDHVSANWEKIRSDLALNGEYSATFDAKGMVGEGFFNEGMMGTGPRSAKFGRTSYVTLRMGMIPGQPPKPFIITTFPSGLP